MNSGSVAWLVEEGRLKADRPGLNPTPAFTVSGDKKNTSSELQVREMVLVAMTGGCKGIKAGSKEIF